MYTITLADIIVILVQLIDWSFHHYALFTNNYLLLTLVILPLFISIAICAYSFNTLYWKKYRKCKQLALARLVVVIYFLTAYYTIVHLVHEIKTTEPGIYVKSIIQDSLFIGLYGNLIGWMGTIIIMASV